MKNTVVCVCVCVCVCISLFSKGHIEPEANNTGLGSSQVWMWSSACLKKDTKWMCNKPKQHIGFYWVEKNKVGNDVSLHCNQWELPVITPVLFLKCRVKMSAMNIQKGFLGRFLGLSVHIIHGWFRRVTPLRRPSESTSAGHIITPTVCRVWLCLPSPWYYIKQTLEHSRCYRWLYVTSCL